MKNHIELMKTILKRMIDLDIGYKRVLADANISITTWYSLTNSNRRAPNLATLQKICKAVDLELVLDVKEITE